MLTIGKFAEAGGVGVETIRFYQRKELLPTPTRDGGIRRYDQQDLRRLRFIRKAQLAGFTLEEIKELIELDSSQDRKRANEMARQRLAKLDEQIAELQQARASLERLVEDCAQGRSKACPILVAFDI